MNENRDKTQFGWDRLLREIRRGQVVPVVGPELLPYHRTLASTLAAALNLSGDYTDADVGAVADAYLNSNGELSEAVEALESLLERDHQVPEALLQLAAIQEFRLFVTTDYSSLIEDALAKNQSSAPCHSRAFSLKQQLEDIDAIPHDVRCVYHLLGHFQRRRRIALARVDQLEYFYELQTERGPKGLLGLLGDRRNLLFLGCDFPEWLGGFFTRILVGKPLYDRDRGLEVIACESTLQSIDRGSRFTAFLRANRMDVYPGNARSFIDELVRRYVPPTKTTAGDVALRAEGTRRGKAFVSYSREDATIVETLVEQLRAKQVDVWFDKQDIAPGDRFDDEIRLAIYEESSAFIPVVSRKSLEADTSYFVKEWKWALDAQLSKMPDVKFIFPVIVEDQDPKDIVARLKQRFPALAEYDVQHSPRGLLNDDSLVEELRNARRRFERNARRGA